MKLNNLQTAIYSTLSGDATLTGYLSTDWDFTPAIFPDVPQEDADDNGFFPYIVFIPISHVPFDDKGRVGGNVVYQIDVWTRSGDYDQGDQIAERIVTLLHRGSLTISGATHVLTQLETIDPALDDDGETRRHLLRFRIIYVDT